MIIDRIIEINCELERLNESEDISGSELVKKALPLWLELNELRERQLKIFSLRQAESDQALESLEERMMELESIPMTDNLATHFIMQNGLQANFEAYMAEQVNKFFVDTDDIYKIH